MWFRLLTGLTVCFIATVSLLFLSVPLWRDPPAEWSLAIGLSSIGWVGIASGSLIMLRRYRGLTFLLALVYLGLSIAPPWLLATLHWYGIQALVLVVLSGIALIKPNS